MFLIDIYFIMSSLILQIAFEYLENQYFLSCFCFHKFYFEKKSEKQLTIENYLYKRNT